MTPTVDIIVVTYNSGEHINGCLDSIVASAFDGAIHIVVVDNASSDDTLEVVRSHAASVRLIENSTNRGFAAACNQGIRATSSDLILLLNPDARLQPTTLRRLVDHLAGHPTAAIVGPKLLHPNASLQPDISATGLFPSFRQALFEYTRLGRLFPQSRWVRDYFLTDWDRLTDRRVAMVQGACLLVRRAVLQEVGLLDERFFLYFEETDLCKSAVDRGWQIHYVGEAAAVHIGSQSMSGRRASARQFIPSLYRFHRKHYGPAEATTLWMVLMPYHGLRVLRLASLVPFKPRDRQLRVDLRTARERFIAHFGLESSKAVLIGLLAAGIVLRLLLCLVPGYAGDQAGWAVLARNATLHGIGHAYGLTARHLGLGVYPPLYHATLAGMGHIYRLISPEFDLTTPTLRALLKLPPLLGDCALMGLLYAAARRASDARCALAVAAAFALNPAVIFNTAYWGMFGDSLFAAGVLGALVAIQRERPSVACVAFTAAVFFKPQAVAFLPLVAWLILKPASAPRWLRLASVCALTVAAIWWPFFVAGTLPEALAALRHTPALFPVLSMNAHNLWYLVSWAHGGSSDMVAVAGLLTPRQIGLLLFGTAYLVALLGLRGPHDPGLMLAAAYIGFAFFVVCTQMHENYSYACIALLTAAALAPVARRFLVILSATALANMALHDPLLEATHWLSPGTIGRLALSNSTVNVLVFVLWTGVMLQRARAERSKLVSRR